MYFSDFIQHCKVKRKIFASDIRYLYEFKTDHVRQFKWPFKRLKRSLGWRT